MAAIAAVPLAGLTSVLGVVIGGNEGPNVVHLILWPGILVALPAAEFISQFLPSAAPGVGAFLGIGLTICWYWAVSYVVLKIWRAIDEYLKKRQ